MSAEKRTLDALVNEAKTSMVPDDAQTNWDDAEAKLFARIENEHRVALASDRGSAGKSRRFAIASAGLALAAGIALFVGKGHPGDQGSTSSIDPVVANAAHVRSSSIVQHRGAGKIEIDGAAVEDGADAFVGDEIETRGATAFFERLGTEASSAAVAVRWSMEDATRVRITRGAEQGATLVLALDHGAVEAQVTPVDHGEAFAVDVEGARVAVHGTHLRVTREARDGSTRVTVDLSEGVISVGPAPRTGSTYGAFVTAPAHVEFDPADVNGTIRVNHVASSVRSPIAFPASTPAPAHIDRVAQVDRDIAPVPRPTTNASHVAASPFSSSPKPNANVAPPPAPPPVDPDAERTVAAAVRACAITATEASAHDAALGTVKVTVTTTLEVRTAENGAVELARFDPPLPPEVQTCAADAIYKTRFARRDVFRIAIKVESIR